MLEVRLLGQIQLRRDGQLIEVSSRPARALLTYLVLNPATSHPRERLAALFWPDSDDESARSNLRGALWRLKEAIGEGFIDAERSTIRFNTSDDFWADTLVIDAPVSDASPVDDLIAAAEAYSGDLLPGFFDDWVLLEREHLQAAFERKMAILLQRLLEAGRWIETLEWAEHWIACGEVPEPAYRALLVAHDALGDASGLALTYRRCVDALMTQLGVEPSEETRRLYQALLSGQNQPVHQAEDWQHRLPDFASPFVGRETELDDLAALLSDPACRLITIVGPGGMGKTRLAVQVASRMGDAGDSVFFVPLAPLESAAQIAVAVAEAIACPLEEGGQPFLQIGHFMRDRKALVILDNFEHLLEGASMVTELLAAAPNMRLLVTSQERLQLRSECLYEINGLASPINDSRPALEQSGAVAMFVAYARRMVAYELADDDLRAAAQIGRLVGGMPLAIEMAAAWLPMLSAAEIAGELEQNLTLLSTPMQDMPERHRSIQTVIQQAWSLLAADEQQALMRLAIFRDGFTREAAKAAAEVGLPVLASLVSKALIRRSTGGRYIIHELIRRFALERLAEAPDAAATYRRGWHYLVDFLHRREPALKGAAIRTGLEAIHHEIDNVREAWQWAAQHGEAETVAHALVSLWLYYSVRGSISEGRALFAEMAAALEGRSPLDWKLRAACLDLTFDARLKQQVRVLLDEIQRGDAGQQLGIFYVTLLGSVIQFMEREEAAAAIQQALAFAAQIDDAWQRGAMLFVAGFSSFQYTGSLTDGKVLLEEAVSILRPLGDNFWLARALITLADIHYHGGDYDQARELVEEGLTHATHAGDRATAAWASILMGRIVAAQGSYREAQQLYEQNLSEFRDLGFPYMRSVARFAAGHFAIMTGNYLEARRQLDESYHLRPDETEPDRQVFYLIHRGSLALATGDFSKARHLLETALVNSRTLRSDAARSMAMNLLGNAAAQLEDYPEAAACYREAIQSSLQVGLLPEVLRSLIGFAVLYQQHGSSEQAVRLAALVAHHYAAHDHEKQRAISLLATLEASMPHETYRAALAFGRRQPVDAFIAQVMSEQ